MVDFEEAKKLYLSGMTQIEVAKSLNTTQKIIWGLFKRNNFKCRQAAPRNQKEENNNNWRGKGADYATYHKRMQTKYGKPKCCEICNTTDPKKSYDWANLTGDYDNPNDYKRMCRSCHWKHDKKIFNIKHMRDKLNA